MPHRHAWLVPTAAATALLTGLGSALAAGPAGAVDASTLIKVSTDPYSGDGAQHATEAEPDTFAYGGTIVSAFQVGRYSDGGSSNTGWATSTDKGKTWKHGYMPGLTIANGGEWERASDPAVAYDAKHGKWLVASLLIGSTAAGVATNASKDGVHWDDAVVAVGVDGKSYDKEWIVCDNSETSPYYGNCYIEVDVTSTGNTIVMSTSTNGGKSWGPQTMPAGTPSGLGGQPLVQPDGTVVVPYSANFSTQNAFRSTDGGDSWSAPVLISNIIDHGSVGIREEPLPVATIDSSGDNGKIYVAWDDCRFRTGCTSNDIVFSTSKDGVTWSKVKRIPIDGLKSGRDHFDPGLGAAGKGMLGLYYYFYPDASCAISECRLEVGYVSSIDGGKTWSKPITLAGPMQLAWLAQAGGAMIGDYLSCDIIKGKAISVFAVGKKPNGSVKNQAMYSAGPLPVTGGTLVARSESKRHSVPAQPMPRALPIAQ